MPKKGYKPTEEHRRKNSESHRGYKQYLHVPKKDSSNMHTFKKGNIPWNKDLTAETDDRVRRQGESESRTKHSEEWIENVGRETFRKHSLLLRGKTQTEESNIKRSKTLTGRKQNSEAVENQKRTKSSKKWKETIGKESIRKRKQTVNSEEYKNTKGKEKARKCSESQKGRKLSEEHLKKMFSHMCLRPNIQEKKLQQLIEELNLPYKYTGNGTAVINNCIPDFVNVNGQKKCIEMFGDYWHGEKLTGRSNKEEEEYRKNIFAEHGYKTLIIWEHELKDENNVLLKLKKFEEETF